ncbi:hypothetical protein [Streptomyces pinistramenti]|uniref:hypothetical protein n=1 Tax=Streptomyces pinistramenti TaxID=2884812 RepID=UPI001D088CCD|nr:hypothetical protein [Streptomyces pinistramenti]MCB5907643.1 hypothetical protein [Streptomyces pinistramenti]
MTYREGTWVIDSVSGRLGQVMGEFGQRVALRGPGGGTEWEADPVALRLATRAEREAAGVRGAEATGGVVA